MPLSCIICIERIKENNAATLPCGHVFDRQCITEWMKTKEVCPYCRQSYPFREITYLYNKDDSTTTEDKYDNIEKLLQEVKKEINKKRSDELSQLNSKFLALVVQEQNLHIKMKAQSDFVVAIEKKYSDLTHKYNHQKKELTSLKTKYEAQEKLIQSRMRAEEAPFKSIMNTYIIIAVVIQLSSLLLLLFCYHQESYHIII